MATTESSPLKPSGILLSQNLLSRNSIFQSPSLRESGGAFNSRFSRTFSNLESTSFSSPSASRGSLNKQESISKFGSLVKSDFETSSISHPDPTVKGIIDAETLLRQLASVTLLANLVSSKIDHGEELAKRVLEIKDILLLRKNEIEAYQGNLHIQNALERLQKTLVRCEDILQKVKSSKFFKNAKFGKNVRNLLRDLVHDCNNLGVSITIAVSKDSVNKAELASQNLSRKGINPEDAELLTVQGDKYFFGIGVVQSYEMALQRYRTAAEGGYPVAQHNIGFMFEFGLGVVQKHSEALHWYQLSADQGYADAMNAIGRLCEYSNSPNFDLEMAAKFYQEAAELGCVDAMNNFGFCIEKGRGVPMNVEKAVRWYHLAADSGSPVAMNNLGSLYYQGKGMEQNFTMAADWFAKAAAQGVSSAMDNLGICYEEGHGVPQDMLTAIHYYKMSAEQGNASGMNNLGFMYLMQNQHDEAATLFRMAADKGCIGALYNMAMMYEKGLSVERNVCIALKLYKRAAEEKHCKAMNRLAALYLGGAAGVKDPLEAHRYFMMAAAENDSQAQNNLGIMYDEGIGIPKDYREAIKWFSLSAEQVFTGKLVVILQNDPDGLCNLAEMYRVGRGVKMNVNKAVQLYVQAKELGSEIAKLELNSLKIEMRDDLYCK